jgi:hypothetical protein
MARVFVVTCDMCGSGEANATTFTPPGARVARSVDLCAEHVVAFADALQPFTQHSRAAGRDAGDSAIRIAARSSKPKSEVTAEGPTAAIRAWAIANGFEMSDRGRIPYDVSAAYEAAHNTPEGEAASPTVDAEVGGRKGKKKETASETTQELVGSSA